jgi:hypothetical protein
MVDYALSGPLSTSTVIRSRAFSEISGAHTTARAHLQSFRLLSNIKLL